MALHALEVEKREFNPSYDDRKDYPEEAMPGMNFGN